MNKDEEKNKYFYANGRETYFRVDMSNGDGFFIKDGSEGKLNPESNFSVDLFANPKEITEEEYEKQLKQTDKASAEKS